MKSGIKVSFFFNFCVFPLQCPPSSSTSSLAGAIHCGKCVGFASVEVALYGGWRFGCHGRFLLRLAMVSFVVVGGVMFLPVEGVAIVGAVVISMLMLSESSSST